MIFDILPAEMGILGRIVGLSRKRTHHGCVRRIIAEDRKAGFQLVSGLMKHIAHGEKDKHKQQGMKNTLPPELLPVGDPPLRPGRSLAVPVPGLPAEKQYKENQGEDQDIGVQKRVLRSALHMQKPGCEVQTPCGQYDPAAKARAHAKPESIHRAAPYRILIKQDAGQLQSDQERRQHICDRRHNSSPCKRSSLPAELIPAGFPKSWPRWSCPRSPASRPPRRPDHIWEPASPSQRWTGYPPARSGKWNPRSQSCPHSGIH